MLQVNNLHKAYGDDVVLAGATFILNHGERAGLVGGLSFMVHLVYGAVAVALATAIMYMVSLSRLGSQLTALNVDLSLADQKALNGGTLATKSAHVILDRVSSADAEVIRSAIKSAFDSGMDMAFLFATLSAMVGLVLALMLDEAKLHKVQA